MRWRFRQTALLCRYLCLQTLRRAQSCHYDPYNILFHILVMEGVGISAGAPGASITGIYAICNAEQHR